MKFTENYVAKISGMLIKAVHLLKIALLVTGQWVTDCVSIKLFMLYSQGQRWKMGLRGCKY